MPFSPQLTVYARVWTLLDAYAPFVSIFGPAGSKHRTDWRDPLLPDKPDEVEQYTAAFPRIALDVGGAPVNQGAPVTFCKTGIYGVPVTVNVDTGCTIGCTAMINRETLAMVAIANGSYSLEGMNKNDDFAVTWVTS